MKIKKILAILTIIPFFGFGQFNTLTFSAEELPKVPRGDSIPIQRVEESNSHEKNIFSFLKGNSSKKQLRKKIDSLTILVNIISKEERNQDKRKKIDFKKIEDSIYKNIKNKLIEEFETLNREKINYQRSSTIDDSFNFSLPLYNELKIISPFTIRKHPIYDITKMHNGVDLRARYENVHTVLNGIVSETGYDRKGGGNFIKIKHKGGIETAYLHLDSVYYKVGDVVKAGYIIAKSGNTGKSTGPHLHFAVKENGSYINPITFLKNLINVKIIMNNYYEKSNAITNRGFKKVWYHKPR